MLGELDVHIRHSGSDLLVDKWMQFSGGNNVTIHDGYADWHEAGVYLADIIEANRGKVIVNCDIDCFVVNWELVHKIIKHMEICGYGYVGVRDDRFTIPHRDNSKDVMNPFFNIFDCRVASVPMDWERIPFVCEPYDEIFRGLRRSNKYMHLPNRQGEDGISTELYYNGGLYAVHSWYAREYGYDEFHTNRINKIIERCEQLL